ncbi:MAG: EFR1 family ferrodoxin [Candidatus Aegiribacteria sp.]|nr:EFR1 family ferrodoxin [Candidatus Aegiribacteria sp.]
MATVLYWFSGTGNSLYAARKVAAGLDDCELLPMAELSERERVSPDHEIVGLVFPMYFEGLPNLVRSFADKLEINSDQYVFAVATFGGGPSWVAGELKQILKHQLDAVFMVPMPGNYLPLYDIASGKKVKKLLSAAESTLKKITEEIRDRNRSSGSDSLPGKLLYRLFHKKWSRTAPGKDAKFMVTSDCISCGLCASVCPVGNVMIVDGSPQWRHRCEECLACVHWCPERAILISRKTAGQKRYHHPEITSGDICVQNLNRKIKKNNSV